MDEEPTDPEELDDEFIVPDAVGETKVDIDKVLSQKVQILVDLFKKKGVDFPNLFTDKFIEVVLGGDSSLIIKGIDAILKSILKSGSTDLVDIIKTHQNSFKSIPEHDMPKFEKLSDAIKEGADATPQAFGEFFGSSNTDPIPVISSTSFKQKPIYCNTVPYKLYSSFCIHPSKLKLVQAQTIFLFQNAVGQCDPSIEVPGIFTSWLHTNMKVGGRISIHEQFKLTSIQCLTSEDHPLIRDFLSRISLSFKTSSSEYNMGSLLSLIKEPYTFKLIIEPGMDFRVDLNQDRPLADGYDLAKYLTRRRWTKKHWWNPFKKYERELIVWIYLNGFLAKNYA